MKVKLKRCPFCGAYLSLAPRKGWAHSDYMKTSSCPIRMLLIVDIPAWNDRAEIDITEDMVFRAAKAAHDVVHGNVWSTRDAKTKDQWIMTARAALDAMNQKTT